METLSQFLPFATPLGVVVLALVIVWQSVKSNKNLKNIGDNHLSELPEMGRTLIRMEEKLGKMNDLLVEIKVLLEK